MDDVLYWWDIFIFSGNSSSEILNGVFFFEAGISFAVRDFFISGRHFVPLFPFLVWKIFTFGFHICLPPVSVVNLIHFDSGRHLISFNFHFWFKKKFLFSIAIDFFFSVSTFSFLFLRCLTSGRHFAALFLFLV